MKLPDEPRPVPEGMSASVVISTWGVLKSKSLIVSRMMGCVTSLARSTCSSLEYLRKIPSVVDRQVPEIGRCETLDVGEVAQEPAGEVDQVWSLVDELAAAGQGRVGAPFPIVADPPAVAVSGAKEHQVA